MVSTTRPTVGLLVNPIAGMGGSVGLHGTDGTARLVKAIRRGARPSSAERAARAAMVLEARAEPRWLVPMGALGAQVLQTIGASTVKVFCEKPARALADPQTGVAVGELPIAPEYATTIADTVAAARHIADHGVDLLLFSGGDGTARDVLAGTGGSVPLLGIPSGVKMRSGVFAVGPLAAGILAAVYLSEKERRRTEVEVVDLDEEGHTVFHGVATVPLANRSLLVPAKQGLGFSSEAELQAACEMLAREVDPSVLHLFGPGTTTARILKALGFDKTAPLSVDALLNGQLVGQDLSEREISTLVQHASRTRLILGVVGGQGFLLGRGNQQLTAKIIERIAPEDVVIVASNAKLAALVPPVLQVEAGDCCLIQRLTGYRRVLVGPRRYVMMRVEAVA